MQVISNSIIFFLIYFFFQVFLYRFLKINLNKISVILFIVIISIFAGFYLNSAEISMNLININLMIMCFHLIMLGIVNHSPALVIIDLIYNKKISSKKKLKELFLKGKACKSVEIRLAINTKSNFIKFKNNGFFVQNNGKKIILFFELVKKIYRLKPDA
jgi:hypothetical protein